MAGFPAAVVEAALTPSAALRPALSTPPAAPDALRIAVVLADLARIPRLPETGRHADPDCWQRHPDCLAARIERTLTGGA